MIRNLCTTPRRVLAVPIRATVSAGTNPQLQSSVQPIFRTGDHAAGRQASPLDLRHLLTKGNAGKRLFDTLSFDRIGACAELVGQLEEFRLFRFLRFHSRFDQFYEDAIRASLALFRECPDALRKPRRKGHALSDGSFADRHFIILHHFAPFHTTSEENATNVSVTSG